MLKRNFAFLVLSALVFGAATLSSHAGIRTGIASASVEAPREFWRAVMEHFYGGYDGARKCWIGNVEGVPHCMRPHRLDTVTANGAARHFVVMGGYRIEGE